MASIPNQAEPTSLLPPPSTCSNSSGTTLVLTDDSDDEVHFDEPSRSLTSSQTDVGAAFLVESVPRIREHNPLRPIAPCGGIRAVPAFKVPIWSMYPTESSENFCRESKFIFHVTCSYFVKIN